MFDKLWNLLNAHPTIEITLFEGILHTLDSKIAGWIIRQMNISITWLTKLMITSPIHFLYSSTFNKIYSVIFKVALSVLIIVIGWQGFLLINNKKSEYDVIHSIIGIWKFPIGTMLAPKLIIVLLKLVNDITLSLLHNQETFTTLAPQLDFIMFIFIIIYVYLLVQVILFYCYRNFALVFLATISPIIFLVFSFDNGNKFNYWKNEILNFSISQLVHVLQLVLLSAIVSQVSDSVMGFSLQIGALIFMVKSPEWLSKYTGIVTHAVSPQDIIKHVGGVSNIAKRFIK